MSTQSHTKSADSELIIARTFNAPRELVFRAFTEAEHLVKWWGPKGLKITVSKLDLRPGGTFHYNMKSDNGFEMWGKFVYQEIVYPERLVFVNSFSDPDENITRPPFSENWPLHILNEWTFTEEDSKTTLVLKSKPLNADEEQQNTFAAGHGSMQEGYGGTLDQLEKHLLTMNE